MRLEREARRGRDLCSWPGRGKRGHEQLDRSRGQVPGGHQNRREWKCENESVDTTARPGTTVTQEGPSGWNSREGTQSTITSLLHAHSVHKATLHHL